MADQLNKPTQVAAEPAWLEIVPPSETDHIDKGYTPEIRMGALASTASQLQAVGDVDVAKQLVEVMGGVEADFVAKFLKACVFLEQFEVTDFRITAWRASAKDLIEEAAQFYRRGGEIKMSERLAEIISMLKEAEIARAKKA